MIVLREQAHMTLMTKMSHIPARCTWIDSEISLNNALTVSSEAPAYSQKTHAEVQRTREHMGWQSSKENQSLNSSYSTLVHSNPKDTASRVLYGTPHGIFPTWEFCLLIKNANFLKYQNTTVSHPVLHLLLQKSNWQCPNNDLTSGPFDSPVSLL